jgi:hypothetical protein
MNSKRQRPAVLTGAGAILVLAASPLFLSGCTRTSAEEGSRLAQVGAGQKTHTEVAQPAGSRTDAVPAAAAAGIQLSFKLDPRLTRGLYMGERWVSPPTYSIAQEGPSVTVDARAQVLDAQGLPTNIGPEWTPADPGMVTVSPARGNQVTITVQRVGESSLTVASQGAARELAVKATRLGDALQVEIAQPTAQR